MQNVNSSLVKGKKMESVLLSAHEYKKLVDAFTWLILEDKRQNPEYYLYKKEDQYD